MPDAAPAGTVRAAASAPTRQAGGGDRALTLTGRASLTAVAALLDYGAKIAVGLVVTPILVGGLGRSLYGMWEMLGRLAGYVNATDGRPTQALRLVVAAHQTREDPALVRRSVGSAIVVWLTFLPLVLAVGATLIWLAPWVTKSGAELRPVVRVAAMLLVAQVAVAGLLTIPESVLRGMNLGYRRMGLQAALNVLGGLLAAGAVWAGLGLAGLAGGQLLLACLAGVFFWLLVRRVLPWFGAARPSRHEVASLLKVSGWLAAGDAVARLLLASDVVILGIVLGPAAVTSYVLTGHALRLSVGIHEIVVGAAIPGLGGLLGAGRFERAAALRGEILALTWLFVTTVGATVLVWNPSFVTLWVGADLFAGPAVNALLVLTMAQTAFIRSDAYIIDATLQPRLRVLTSAGAAVVTIALAVLLAARFGTVGLCLGVLGGRLTQSLAYPAIVNARLGRRAHASPSSIARIARPAVVLLLLFAAAAALGDSLRVRGWLEWALGVAVTAPSVCLLALAAGMAPGTRRSLVSRVRGLVRRRA